MGNKRASSVIMRPSHLNDTQFTQRKNRLRKIFDYIAGDDYLIQKQELKKW